MLEREHRVSAIQRFRGEHSLEDLERLGTGQRRRDPHERRPLLASQIGLGEKELTKQTGSNEAPAASTSAAITRSPTAGSGIEFTTTSITSG